MPIGSIKARYPISPALKAIVTSTLCRRTIPTLRYRTMLQRNLLYTGVTRGKRLVVLVGQRKAVAIAVRNVLGRRRWSKLQEWLGTTSVETSLRG